MTQLAKPNCRATGDLGRSHSLSFDHRRRPETLRTAMATAFFCPTSGIFRALALVNGRSVRGDEHVELAESVCDGPAIEARNDLAGIGINVVDISDIAVVDLFVVVVLDLHDLVTRGEGPAEAFDLALAGRIQCGLKLDIERSSSDAATVHRTKHLDVADGIKAKPFWDAGFHKFDDQWDSGFGIVCLNEIEVAIFAGLGKIWDEALVDPMGAGDVIRL
jgi:hypothetical protein